MSKNGFVVDYQITSRCNLNCDFCAGSPRNILEESINVIKKSIDKLVLWGVDTIVFTGGEPLIRKDTPGAIKYANEQGLNVYLSTNAILLKEIYPDIKEHLSCLGMPLDGSTPEISRIMGRGKKQYSSLLKVLKYFNENPPNHKLKIGTVVSKLNQQDIPKIGNLLYHTKGVFSPDVWRLYEFSPLGRGRISQKKHKIKEESFKEICSSIKKTFPNKEISELSHEDSDDSYIFIDPSQRIRKLSDNHYRIMGDLKTASIEELQNIQNKCLSVIKRGEFNRGWLNEKR